MNTDRFKYRVWLGHLNRYADFDKHDEFPEIYSDGSLTVNVIGGYLCNPAAAEIEQCTGRKDKHGKLIYENDWVKCYLNGKPFHTYLVGWDDRACAFYFSGGDQESSQSFEDFDEVEVVGNIHDVEYME